MKKLGKAVIISMVLIMSPSTATASADTYYDYYIYNEEEGEYYSASINVDTNEMLIDHTPIYFYVQGSESEVGDGEYKGYDLYYEEPDTLYMPNIRSWWWGGSKKNGYTIEWVGNGQKYSYATIKIPDSINGIDVVDIDGSCDFKEFKVNSENKYLKCVDNVIFSKDGKRLISYAQCDRRREYVIPEGTEIIDHGAIWGCAYLHTVTVPDSVTEIKSSALASANYSLSLVNFYDFDVKIDRGAFGRARSQSDLMLKSGVTVSPKAQGNVVSWDEVYGASYYEIYQKQSSGEYTLLGKTKSLAHTFGSLKPGAEYTFAVKPIAVIPAANYDKEKDEGEYPESFTIEGTVSEDIVISSREFIL